MAGCFSVHKVRSVVDTAPETHSLATQYIPLASGVERQFTAPEYNGAGILTDAMHANEYLFVAPEDWKQWAQELDDRAKPGGRSFVRDTILNTQGYTRKVVIGPSVCAVLSEQIRVTLAELGDKRSRWACFAAKLQEYLAKAVEQNAFLLVD